MLPSTRPLQSSISALLCLEHFTCARLRPLLLPTARHLHISLHHLQTPHPHLPTHLLSIAWLQMVHGDVRNTIKTTVINSDIPLNQMLVSWWKRKLVTCPAGSTHYYVWHIVYKSGNKEHKFFYYFISRKSLYEFNSTTLLSNKSVRKLCPVKCSNKCVMLQVCVSSSMLYIYCKSDFNYCRCIQSCCLIKWQENRKRNGAN